MTDKQKVKDLENIKHSGTDQHLMVLTDLTTNQLRKEKISDFISDTISEDLNNGLLKGSDERLYIKDTTNANNITNGTLSFDRLPNSGVNAGNYQYPVNMQINEKGIITSVKAGEPGANNANTDLSNITDAGKEVIKEFGGGFTPAMFQPFFSFTKLNHPSLVLANYSWLNKGYESAYNLLVERYNAGEDIFWHNNVIQTGGVFSGNYIYTGASGAYLTVNGGTPPLAVADSWELKTKYTYNGGGTQKAIVTGTSPYSAPQLFADTNNVLQMYISSNGSNWDVAGQASGITLTIGTTYYLKFGFDGTKYYVDYNTDGSDDYTNTITIVSSVKTYCSSLLNLMGRNSDPTLTYSSGQMDLSRTSLDVNGTSWWTGASNIRWNEQYKMAIITPAQIKEADAIYAATRQAMYFILDVENTRFKLPRTDIMPQFSSDPNAVGGYNEPALPNATGYVPHIGLKQSETTGSNGALYTQPSNSNYGDTNSGSNKSDLYINLSRSNSMYKDGATVQPPTNNVLLYFYLGESQIEPTSITGEVLENLNNKADISEVRELRDKLYEINKVTIKPTLISSRIANGNFAIDISNIVPDDGCDYDLYLSIWGDTSNNGSGNNRNLNIFLSPDYAANWVLRYTQDGTNQSQGTSAIIPLLKDSRILYCSIFGTDNYIFKALEVYLHAYRKVGV